MDAMHAMLDRAKLVDGPGAGPLMAMLLERAGHDLGHAALSGTRVIDVRVVEDDVLLVDMAVPHIGGCEVVRVAQRLAPGAPVMAVAIGVAVFGSAGEIPPDPRHCAAHPPRREKLCWGLMIDLVAGREQLVALQAAGDQVDA